MLNMIATLGYLSFVLVTVALVWAVGELQKATSKQTGNAPRPRRH